MSEQKPDDWNPLDPAVLRRQCETYDSLRERCPVARSAVLGWSLFKHADITAVLADTVTYSNAAPFPAIPNGMDPPEHGLYRAALDANFSAAALAQLEPQVRTVAAVLLAAWKTSGTVEFMKNFAHPFVMSSQCTMLGWPQDQWQSMHDWTSQSQQAALAQDQHAGKVLADSFAALVGANLERHRKAHGHASGTGVPDATAQLLQTRVAGKPLSDEQIVTVLRNWIAGQGTAAAGLGIVVLHLALDAGIQRQLRKDSALIPGAIEEILRADGPLVANSRTATADVAIGGQAIAKGDKVSLMWIAGDRDSAVFDEAAAIRIGRDTGNSLVWGQGIHVCQGAGLARLELRVALQELLARTRHFELAGAPPARSPYPGNGPAELQLQFS